MAHREELKAFDVKFLSLFNTVVRGEAGPESNVDILVKFEDPSIFTSGGTQGILGGDSGMSCGRVTPDGLHPGCGSKSRAEVWSSIMSLER